MFQVEDIELIANDRTFNIPGRDGASIVSPLFGVHNFVMLEPGSPMFDMEDMTPEQYLVATAAGLRDVGATLLSATKLFTPGISIFWVTTIQDQGEPTKRFMKCFTLANVPDSLPLERIFDIAKFASFDHEAVYREIGRIADIRTNLGLLVAP